MNHLSALLTVNRQIAAAVEHRWPYRGIRIFDEFPALVASAVGARAQPLVIDVGGGRETPWAALLDQGSACIVGVDLSEEAMRGNDALKRRLVADVVRDGLPFGNAEVDIVTSRSVLEHLESADALIAESARVLKPGGESIHLFSTRWAPFAIPARVLPHRLARQLLYSLHPDAVEDQGFKTFYDRCTAAQMTALVGRHGMHVVWRIVSYRSSQYFRPLGPLFALARAYEDLAARLGREALASYVTIVARKAATPPSGSGRPNELVAPVAEGPT